MIKLASLETIPVPWISFNTSPFMFSNPKQDHAHNGTPGFNILDKMTQAVEVKPTASFT